MKVTADTPAQVRDLPLRARTEYLLRRFGVHARKSLGQNFLTNEGAAKRLAEAACAPGEALVEIGGGLGALTVPLAASGLPLKVVEIDPSLARVLVWLTADLSNVEVLVGDFLKLPPEALWPRPAVAVGNLPYLSAGAILQHAWALDSPYSLIVATVQREVADRLRTGPGTKAYGPLSVLAAVHTRDIAVVAQMSPESFEPIPGVESTALSFVRNEALPPALEDPDSLNLAIRGAFGGRRKTLLNSLKMSLHWDKPTAEEVLREAHLDGKRRGETLELAELLTLANAIHHRVERAGGDLTR